MSQQTPAYRAIWRVRVNEYFNMFGLERRTPTRIIVNAQDLTAYDEYLFDKYKGGAIPTYRGQLIFMGIPVGISDDLKPGECVLEIK